MISDGYGRTVSSLRLSVTSRCNFSCGYCHKEGAVPSEKEMSLQEIESILRIARELGIRKLKLTGGEPMMREDIIDIVAVAARHMDEVSMTTNGTGLRRHAEELKAAGLARINISLDTLDPARFEKITGRDCLHVVLEGIRASVAAGLEPVKLNVVAQPGMTVRDIEEVMEFAWEAGAIPQVIQTVGDNGGTDITEDIQNKLELNAQDMRRRSLHRRSVFTIAREGKNSGMVELVRPMHNTEFCANCTRIRITADGMLKPCLMHNNDLVNIIGPLRKGLDHDSIMKLFEFAIRGRKPYWTKEDGS